MVDIGDLITIGVGLVVFFAIFGAMVPTVIESLNETEYEDDLEPGEESAMTSMRSWYFLGGMLLVIALIAGVIMSAFR